MRAAGKTFAFNGRLASFTRTMNFLKRLSVFFLTAILLASCAAGQSQESPSPSPTATASPESATPVERKASYSEVHVGGQKVIALTFDDGPSKKLTPQLLDTLKRYGAHCTFFVVGQNAAEHPEILQRAVAEGHEIADHSWSHPSLSKLSVSGINSQLDRTDAAIEKAIGHKPVLVRPPYGATNSTVRRILAERGQTDILWSVDPLDWKYRNADRVERELVKGAAPGAILLSHDIHPTTVAAIPAVLARLTEQGYRFVTVSELLDMEVAPTPPPTPTPTATPELTATPEPEEPSATATASASMTPAASLPPDRR